MLLNGRVLRRSINIGLNDKRQGFGFVKTHWHSKKGRAHSFVLMMTKCLIYDRLWFKGVLHVYGSKIHNKVTLV